jgi:predicted nucleic acid-binding protein
LILVDTSVWIDHLHTADEDLVRLLEDDQVCCHPLIIAEMAVGSIARRQEVLGLLQNLCQLRTVNSQEVLAFVESNQLWGRGLSAVDAHILASARISSQTAIWTRDKVLDSVAAKLGLSAPIRSCGVPPAGLATRLPGGRVG